MFGWFHSLSPSRGRFLLSFSSSIAISSLGLALGSEAALAAEAASQRFAVIPQQASLQTDATRRLSERNRIISTFEMSGAASYARLIGAKPLYPSFVARHGALGTASAIASKITTQRRQKLLARAQGNEQSSGLSNRPDTVARAMHAQVIEVQSTTGTKIMQHKLQADLGSAFRVIPIEAAGVDGGGDLPNDTYFHQQWGLHNVGQVIGQGSVTEQGAADQDIDAPLAWAQTMGSGAVVAVIDLGVDYEAHPDVRELLWLNQDELKINGAFPPGLDSNQDGTVTNIELLAMYGTYSNARVQLSNGTDSDGNGFVDDLMGWDFVHLPDHPGAPACASGEDCTIEDNNPRESLAADHSTKIASVIAAKPNNGQAMSGVAPLAKVMNVRAGFASVSGGSIYHDDLGEGILYAYENGADVVSIQTSSTVGSASLPAVEIAYQGGVVISASAGNNSQSVPYYPAAYTLLNSDANVIAVGGTAPGGNKYTSSNYGSWISLGAPGRLIFRVGVGGVQGWSSGTSYAAPHVSAVAGLVKSKFPCFSGELIRSVLVSSTTQYLAQQTFALGTGLLNAANALDLPPLGCGFPPGDANGDSSVNFNDLNLVIGNFSCSGVCQGDVNFDAKVDFSDLNLILGNFNT